MVNRKHKMKKNSGVTLLEILVAMSIFTVGVFMTFNIFPRGFAASMRSKNKIVATNLAAQLLENIIQDKTDLSDAERATGCLYKPPTLTDIVDPAHQDDAGFTAYTWRCRYFYAVHESSTNMGIRAGTPDHFDMGDRSTLTTWKKCKDNGQYWYHIEVTPVMDPSSNYSGFDATHRPFLYRDFGSCSRVTVRVVGPLDVFNTTTWDPASNGKGGRMPVEAILSTFVANKCLASTTVNKPITNDTYYNPGQVTAPKNAIYLAVYDIRNFTLFNGLYQEERNNPYIFYTTNESVVPNCRIAPPQSDCPYGVGKPEVGHTNDNNFSGNDMGLDNIMIERKRTEGDVFWVFQTDKIVSMWPLSATGGNGNTIPGILKLEQPLYYYQSKYNPGQKYSKGPPKVPYIPPSWGYPGDNEISMLYCYNEDDDETGDDYYKLFSGSEYTYRVYQYIAVPNENGSNFYIY
jgi:type II secretory pathway pseudopilin PulG